MQRIDVLKAVARQFRDLVVDTVPGSLTGSSIDAAALVHVNGGRLLGKDAYIYSGAGAGQQRTVASFDTINHRLIIAPVFSSLPSINSSFLVFNTWRKDEYDNALDRAVGQARLKNLQEKSATISLVGTQYEYAVPSGYESVGMIQLVPTTSNDYRSNALVANQAVLERDKWWLETLPVGSVVIVFDPRKMDMPTLDNYWIRVIGQAKPDIAGTDNATIPQDLEEYLINHTALILAQSAPEFKDRVRFLAVSDNQLEEYITTRTRGKSVK